MADKKEIRIKKIEERNSISNILRAQKNSLILSALESISDFKKAKNILFYYSVKNEVDTLSLIEKYSGKKSVFLPKIIDNNEFIALPFRGMDKLKNGKYNIPEPVYEGEEEFDKAIDLVLVPGVAFDRKGNRIGMGKGFYDRYLGKLKTAVKIGLAYEEQMLDQLPKDPYDESVNIIITDKNIYNCN